MGPGLCLRAKPAWPGRYIIDYLRNGIERAGSLFDLHITGPYLSSAIIVLLAFLFSLFTMRAEAPPAESLATASNPDTFQRE